MLLTSEQIKNYREYAMSAEPNVRTLQRFFLAVSEDWITLSDEVERTRRLVERDTATIERLNATIHEWEESDRARGVFTDLIDEGQREVERLRQTVDDMLRAAGKNAANILDPVDAIRQAHLAARSGFLVNLQNPYFGEIPQPQAEKRHPDTVRLEWFARELARDGDSYGGGVLSAEDALRDAIDEAMQAEPQSRG